MSTDTGTDRFYRWIEVRDDRPPRFLNFLFWGNSLVLFFLLGAEAAIALNESDSGAITPLTATALIASVSAFLIWPWLWWGDHPSLRHRALSIAFYIVTPSMSLVGGYFGFFVLALAIANAVAVFGARGGIIFSSCTAVYVFLIDLLSPEQSILLSVLSAVLWLYLALGITLIAIVLFDSARRSKRTRELLTDLEEAHSRLEEAHTELRRHADRVRELSIDQERARMSREMHDSTGHYLTALAMSLSNALRFRTARPESAWDEIEQARELAREALTDTRRWVRALRPLQLEGRAGTAAMRAMAESFDGGGAHIVFAESGTWPELSQEAELVCYRALQEGLTNAMRHSGGDRVEVAVAASQEGVAVTVTDNGNGADEGAARSGFGLRGLRERVASVGGSVSTENPTEGGFRLRITVPPAGRAATVAAGGAV